MLSRDKLISWLDTVDEGEPLFVLRAQDRLASATVRDWCQRARYCGVTPQEKIDDANDIALLMDRWREVNGGGKFPD